VTTKRTTKHDSAETTAHDREEVAHKVEAPTPVKVASTPDGAFTTAGGNALALIRAAKKQIPGAAYLDPAEQRALGPRYSVDPRFLEAACTAVEASPELARLTGLDTVKVRDAIRMDAAFNPVEQEAESLSDAIHGARVTTYVAAVDQADAVLRAARGLLSTSAKKEIGDHVARMSNARMQKRKTSARPTKKKGTAKSDAADAAATDTSAATSDAVSAAKTTTVTTMTT
jgi:hypothetical protein